MLIGKVEMGVEMLESLRAKLWIPGKGTRKGMEDLLLELDALLGMTCGLAPDVLDFGASTAVLRRMVLNCGSWQALGRRLNRTWMLFMRSASCSSRMLKSCWAKGRGMTHGTSSGLR
jgi:hypothetical protein